MCNQIIAGRFWDTCDGKLYNAPNKISSRDGLTFVAEVPEEYKDASPMTYLNERTGKPYIMFVKAGKYPLRYNIEENLFETRGQYKDGVTWSKYEKEKQS